jgi:hypothetical protein
VMLRVWRKKETVTKEKEGKETVSQLSGKQLRRKSEKKTKTERRSFVLENATWTRCFGNMARSGSTSCLLVLLGSVCLVRIDPCKDPIGIH